MTHSGPIAALFRKSVVSMFFASLCFGFPTAAGAASTNLVPNPSLETSNGNLPANWAEGNWGTNTSVFAYPVTGHSGNGASVTVSNWSDGDAKWYFNEISVTPGAEYVFSDWSKSSVDTEIVVQEHLSTGGYAYPDLGTVTGTGSWKQTTKSFTVPTNVTALTVFHLIAKNGTLSVDDYSLTQNTAAFSSGMVTFSFDDGYESAYKNGLPILDKAGIKSTQAIITRAFGDPDYVTKAQVKAMAANGHEIASHTRTHADLTTITKKQAQTEITGSVSDLRALGITPTTFVYPYGTYNDTVISLLKSAGFKGARAVEDGFNTPSVDPFILRDQHVTSDVTFAQIQAWIDTAIANKQWLVLELHQQNTTGEQYSNTPALLQQVVDYVKAKNVKTVTLGQGISMLGK